MQLRDFNFELPSDLIAQEPTHPRDQARLLVYDRSARSVQHARVADLPTLLPPDTLLVANNSRVRHARLYALAAGKPCEVLILGPLPTEGTGSAYRCLLRGRRFRSGLHFQFFTDSSCTTPVPLTATLAGSEPQANMTTYRLDFPLSPSEAEAAVEQYGHTPLPPYITRSTADPERYQTVFAQELGSAAAPTAGLHFTPELINRLSEAGHEWAEVTLHVGLGTFLPLRQEVIEENHLHTEASYISAETAARLNHVRNQGKKLLAVGTTSVRTLESHTPDKTILPGWNETNLFIYPGYLFHTARCLLTNFHLPRSSLLLLVAAFLGNDPAGGQLTMEPAEMSALLHQLYQTAIDERYRFFSFGDAMLIL